MISQDEGEKTESDHDGNELEQQWTHEEAQSSLNSTLQDLELTPLKFHAVSGSSKVTHGKRKLEQINREVTKKVATALSIEEQHLMDTGDKSESKMNLELKCKSADLDYLVSEMKKKLLTASRREKIQILTLTPKSWSIRYASKLFKVSRGTMRKAILLREQRGILALPGQMVGRRISDDVKKLVVDFYCSDDNSRQMPGKKDYVSLGKGQHMSKRLILGNIRELYVHFKEKHPDVKLGFSTFAALRPKWCIIAGASGTHSVCVCTYHENIKLMLAAIKDLGKTYHELIDMIVCDSKNNECMVHRCTSCPGIDEVESFLQKNFE